MAISLAAVNTTWIRVAHLTLAQFMKQMIPAMLKHLHQIGEDQMLKLGCYVFKFTKRRGFAIFCLLKTSQNSEIKCLSIAKS